MHRFKLTSSRKKTMRVNNEYNKNSRDVLDNVQSRQRVVKTLIQCQGKYQPIDVDALDQLHTDCESDEDTQILMWFSENIVSSAVRPVRTMRSEDNNTDDDDRLNDDAVDMIPAGTTDDEIDQTKLTDKATPITCWGRIRSHVSRGQGLLQSVTNSIFLDAFFQNNPLEHASQVMGYHPDYLRTFLATQNFLLREDGPLPYDFRHYIAILAAARHHCTYLVKLHEQEFLLHNGNPEWLKGIDYAPVKLQEFYEINKILAHQPWLITKEHMAKLLKGSEPWSLSELMHGIIILTHFHSLCSFIYGCGINPELDLDGFSYQRICSEPSSDLSSVGCERICDSNDISREGLGVEQLMEKMRRLTENSPQLTSEEELIKRFKHVENQNAEITVPSNKQSSPKAEILRYVRDADFSYTDFDSRDTNGGCPIFQARDYSWDDHGFSLSNRLYSDVGNFLDNKFSTAYQLTYYTMGDKREVDTSSFRRAIWNHIHSMYGILHEDYDYAEVEQLLELNLKAYMKTLTCYPERLQKKDYENVMREFKHSEKVHVNLMLMDARLQAELLYALRALYGYLT